MTGQDRAGSSRLITNRERSPERQRQAHWASQLALAQLIVSFNISTFNINIWVKTRSLATTKMTIVTKPLSAVKEEKKEEAEEALVRVDEASGFKSEAPVDQPDLNLDPVPIRDPRRGPRSRQQHNLAFLSLCTGLISLMGFMAGVHLYKSIYMKRCK